MSKTPDEIMDDLAIRVEALIDKQMEADTSIFWGEGKDQDDTWLWVLMVEAHKAGGDMVFVRTAYLNGDVAAVATNERINRFAAACSYSSGWIHDRKAA